MGPVATGVDPGLVEYGWRGTELLSEKLMPNDGCQAWLFGAIGRNVIPREACHLWSTASAWLGELHNHQHGKVIVNHTYVRFGALSGEPSKALSL